MSVLNIHERRLRATPAAVGTLIDGLSSRDDNLWPTEHWPPMRFRDGLRSGSRGGHGPIRYSIIQYDPGQSISFTFTNPQGFDGQHRFEMETISESETILRHVVDMELKGLARLSWPLVFQPLHDALLEDALDKAARSTGPEPPTRRWSLWVRCLRKILQPRQRT